MKYWNCINDCGDQESFSKEWLLAYFPDTNPRLGWAGEAPAARSHCEWSPLTLTLSSGYIWGSLTVPGTFQEPSFYLLDWNGVICPHMPPKVQNSAVLLAATRSLLTSPSTPSFSASFTIWSVSSLLKQPSSLVMCILFFLPAFLSAAGTLRMVLVTLSKSPGCQEHHSKLEDPRKYELAEQFLFVKALSPSYTFAKTVVLLSN